VDDVQYPTLRRSPTLSDRVTESVLELIRGNQLHPGDRLPSERDLALRFGVSRTVVREALRSLAAKGVLDVRSGSGAVVARVGADTASEVLRMFVHSARDAAEGDRIEYEQIDDVREMLETRIARIAATAARAEDLAKLRDLNQQLSGAKNDVELASRLDVAFHRAIALSTHNPLYPVMMDSIEPVLLEVRLRTLGKAGRPARALKAHKAITERLEQGDSAGAEAAMSAHLEDSRAVWRGLILGSKGS
jgi:GntR family transcriptional regulator, transcriptional repressor for pyruvate dehydrogenase complex